MRIECFIVKSISVIYFNQTMRTCINLEWEEVDCFLVEVATQAFTAVCHSVTHLLSHVTLQSLRGTDSGQSTGKPLWVSTIFKGWKGDQSTKDLKDHLKTTHSKLEVSDLVFFTLSQMWLPGPPPTLDKGGVWGKSCVTCRDWSPHLDTSFYLR